MTQRPQRTHGFTILELAITLAVMGVLAASVLVPLVAQVTQRRIADTERTLEQAKEALLGYAAATGRFPCPATLASNGVEAFTGGNSAANGICETFWGFLPAVTLGFTPVDSGGFAIDGWGTTQNRIRYAVAISTTGTNGIQPTTPTYTFTRTGGMRDATAETIANSRLLFVCSGGTGAAAGVVNVSAPACGAAPVVTLTNTAPAVIWSNGANAAIGGTGTDEAQNPSTAGGSADRIFVSKPHDANFDDIVTWLSVGTLVSRLILAGQLP